MKTFVVVFALSLFCFLPCNLLFAQATSNQVPLRIIVVNTADQAQQILERLKKGEDFAVLAKEKSTDPTADSGGYMGTIDSSTLRSELKEALTGIAPGQFSPI